MLFAGSFDPVTVGHMDIIARASALAEELIVAVMHNPGKTGHIPPEERVMLLQEACRNLSNVRVIRHSVTNRRRASRHSPKKSTVRRRTRVRCAARSFPVQNVFIASVLCGFFQKYSMFCFH